MPIFRQKNVLAHNGALGRNGQWEMGNGQWALGRNKSLDTRSKCVVTMSPTQLDQPMAVRSKSGPPGLPKDIQGPRKGLSGLKRALLGAPRVL